MTTCERLSLRIVLSGRTVLATGTYAPAANDVRNLEDAAGCDAQISHFAPGSFVPRLFGIAEGDVFWSRMKASVTFTA